MESQPAGPWVTAERAFLDAGGFVARKIGRPHVMARRAGSLEIVPFVVSPHVLLGTSFILRGGEYVIHHDGSVLGKVSEIQKDIRSI